MEKPGIIITDGINIFVIQKNKEYK